MFAELVAGGAAGSVSHWYLERDRDPRRCRSSRGSCRSARSTSGLALVLGFWTPLFAFVAFFMALNFQIASGALFKYSFLTSGYGLPVLGATLALAIGGVRLPWSIRLIG